MSDGPTIKKMLHPPGENPPCNFSLKTNYWLFFSVLKTVLWEIGKGFSAFHYYRYYSNKPEIQKITSLVEYIYILVVFVYKHD